MEFLGDAMIHLRSKFKDCSPRSGLSENSPSLQCWVRVRINEVKPVKRATEVEPIVGVLGEFLPFASRTVKKNASLFPSDKSLGYFQTSASRTISTLASL